MQNGWDVTVFDNLSSGRKEFIEHHLNEDNFIFHEIDVLDSTELKGAFKNYDVVFHLVGNPNAMLGVKRPIIDFKLETIALFNILEAMRINRVKKLVFTSGSTVYGDMPKPASENGPFNPMSPYGAGKLSCEAWIQAYCHSYDMQAWIFRFANVVGSRATHGVVYDFIRKLRKNGRELEILGDGENERSYIHVSECLDGVLYGFTQSNERVNTFNIASNSLPTKVNKVAEIIIEEMGLKNVEFGYTGGERAYPGDQIRVSFDVSKINKLGWKAKLTSDQAVRRAARELLIEIRNHQS